MSLHLFLPSMVNLSRVNKTMLGAPHGDLIATQFYGGAQDLLSIVTPQVYYSAIEKSPNLSNLFIDKKLKDFIVNEIVADLESNNHDVMYSIAEELAEEDLRQVDHTEAQLLNQTEQRFSRLMNQYNQWDSAMTYGTLYTTIDRMTDFVTNNCLHAIVDNLVKRYNYLPSDISAMAVGPTVLKIQC